jgi:ectoine hydroxylase-related dioxygenase (phytanoyl-CoA dioxygenase family)
MLAIDNIPLARDGFMIVARGLGDEQVRGVLADLSADDSSVIRPRRLARGPQVYAMRNLLDLPYVRSCAASDAVRALVEPHLGRGAGVVRALFFDKSPGANWTVPWHQDLSIAVRERIDVPEYGPWSVKDGVVHVQPPREVLEAMLTVRLHLDDCGEDNGPLCVVAGSHAAGVIPSHRIEAMVDERPVKTCLVPRGGALLMRPLLLHASSPARRPANRRVLHLEYAASDLPGRLRWHWDFDCAADAEPSPPRPVA